MKWTAAILLVNLAACASPPAPPPVPVEVRVPVPVPCRIAEPVCVQPAYDAATKAMPIDARARLLRAETAQYEDCVRLYREALAACREP